MSAKAIREYDGKLMLSKYLQANSGQTHQPTQQRLHSHHTSACKCSAMKAKCRHTEAHSLLLDAACVMFQRSALRTSRRWRRRSCCPSSPRPTLGCSTPSLSPSPISSSSVAERSDTQRAHFRSLPHPNASLTRPLASQTSHSPFLACSLLFHQAGLIKLNATWEEASAWVEERRNKEVQVEVRDQAQQLKRRSKPVVGQPSAR